MVTANVPSAKKIIIFGPDAYGGIPTQFSIMEDTQFQQLLIDSSCFFQIPEDELDHCFLIDAKTGVMHSFASYVRDFYFFHRSFYPQVTLIKMDPTLAMHQIRDHLFYHKFMEIGKILLTYSALAHSPTAIIPQRTIFIHDELAHLPSFPRRCLETCFGMYEGKMGEELQVADALHKFAWTSLISDLFEKIESAFMFGGDLHLFINVINGILILHTEDLLVLRRCMAAYLSVSIHFNTLFSTQGFFLIMPTILRCYSQRQTNKLFIQVVEFVCKQFYILHRKPFLLQMFGSVADICDQNNNDLEVNVMLVKAKYLFKLLLAMENMNECVDQLDILSLVPYSKPFAALDLCYRDEPNSFFILLDAIASCVTVCAFAAETRRSHQMLICLQCILPHYMMHLAQESSVVSNIGAIKLEINAYTTLAVEMRALISSAEALSRGPARSFETGSVTERGKSFITNESPLFDPPTVLDDDHKQPILQKDRRYTAAALKEPDEGQANSTEIQKELFRGPRDALLTLCSIFIVKGSARLKELAKLSGSEHMRIPELIDHKSHLRLSEIAVSLLKVAPYNLSIMGCVGLQRYFTNILPITDWSIEANEALVTILKRLDKTISKISKKPSTRRRANWYAISMWISGIHQTLTSNPYIAHLQSLRAITLSCLRLVMGEGCSDETNSMPSTIISPFSPPLIFCNAVIKLSSVMMTGQMAFSIELVCGQGESLDRPESLICNFLVPIFLKMAVPTREHSQFQTKDILYCLNDAMNLITPQIFANLSSNFSFARDSAGRQSSIVTDRGHSASVSAQKIIRESIIQSTLLELKVIAVSLQKQMTMNWVKMMRIIKELVSKKISSTSLLSFVEFMMASNLPISLLIMPALAKMTHRTQTVELEANWQTEFRERINKRKNSSIAEIQLNGAHTHLHELSRELQTMKEDFSTKNFDFLRSHTPTIVGDIHSDSGSSQSVSTHHRGESRKMSSSALTRLRNAANSKGSNLITSELQGSTIMEDAEDSDQSSLTKVKIGDAQAQSITKPSMPERFPKRGASLQKFRTSFRNRTSDRAENVTTLKQTHAQQQSLRRAMSLRSGKPAGIIKPASVSTQITIEEPNEESIERERLITEGSEPNTNRERSRVVSFSTPRTTFQLLSEGGVDSDECIIPRYHRI